MHKEMPSPRSSVIPMPDQIHLSCLVACRAFGYSQSLSTSKGLAAAAPSGANGGGVRLPSPEQQRQRRQDPTPVWNSSVLVEEPGQEEFHILEQVCMGRSDGHCGAHLPHTQTQTRTSPCLHDVWRERSPERTSAPHPFR
jgi:hypothetical protein